MLVGTEHTVAWYRNVSTGPATWGTPTRTLIGTFQATIQPFTADDGLYNNQQAQNVRYLLICRNPDLAIINGDELEFWSDTVQRVSNAQRNKSGIIEHIEIFSSDIQKGV